MHSPTNRLRLEQLAWIAIHGPDARRFLHGQVSQDVLGLPQDRVALAGLHTPQGRTVAILRLVPLADDALLLGLPVEIAAAVIQRLRRYVLRSKLVIEDATAGWGAIGLAGVAAAPALAAAGLLPAGTDPGTLCRRDGLLAWRHGADPERFIVLAPLAAALPVALQPDRSTESQARRDWHAADVAAGLPEVHAATTEAFVAQMLNLDVLGGISFEKGCYTGQEVIARAHYRGRVKRRLQRFRTSGTPAASLAPGDAGTLADGRAFRIVQVATLPDGRVEFLAVAPMAVGAAAEDDVTGPSPGASPSPAGRTDPPTLHAEQLPLPYVLPD